MLRGFIVAVCVLFLGASPSPAAQPDTMTPVSANDKAQPVLSYDNSLVVEVYLEKFPSDQNIEVYQHEGGYLLPLGFISQLIDFSIDVNVEDAVAQGWFISENRTFLLDLSRQEVVVEGEKKKFPHRLAVPNFDDIYVDSSLFSEWFPVDVELNFSRLILTLKPREKLPIQLRQEREKKWGRLGRAKQEREYGEVENSPYSLYSVPFTDVDLSHNYNSNSNRENLASYSLLSQGDLGFATSRLSMAGDSQDALSNVRFRAGRSDYKGELLWGTATEFYVGDIEAVSVPLASSSSRGRGATISNIDLQRSSQFDSTSFIGDSLPGWEVELYRNGVLIGAQVVGNEGRYEFLDIDIFYGSNVFRIVSYGPQGQVQEEKKTLRIDSSILSKGQFRYEASVDEKSKSLFTTNDEDTVMLHDDGVRAVVNGEYGITSRTTGTFGTVYTPLDDGKSHHYQMLGLRNSMGPLLNSLNFAYDEENGGWASEFSVNTGISSVNIKAQHSIFSDFSSEVVTYSADPRVSNSALDIDGSVGVPLLGSVAYSLGGEYENFESDRAVKTLTNRLSTSIAGIALGNSLGWSRTEGEDESFTQLAGGFSVRGRYRGFFLRASTNYELEPIEQITSINLSAQKLLENEMNLRVELQQDLTNDNLTSVTTSLNKQFKYVRGSVVLRGDDNDNFSVGTRLSFSLGREPRSGAWVVDGRGISGDGAVSARAFLDANYDGVYNDGDEILPDAGFLINGRPRGETAKEAAFITGINTNSPSLVSVDVSTVEDPYWVSTKENYTVIGRPGKVMQLDFPIAITTEIDGTVFFAKGEMTRSAPHVTVQLVRPDGEVVQETKAEFDGFYLFEKVIPGEYYVQLVQEELDRIKAVPVRSELIKITQGSDIISGMDLTIEYRSAVDNDITIEELESPEKVLPEPVGEEVKVEAIEAVETGRVIEEKMALAVSVPEQADGVPLPKIADSWPPLVHIGKQPLVNGPAMLPLCKRYDERRGKKAGKACY